MIISKLLLILLLLKQAPQVEPMQAGIQLVIGGGEILVNGLLSIGGIVFGKTVYDSAPTRKESIFQRLEMQQQALYHEARSPERMPPGYNDDWRKVRGEPAWLDPSGLKWKEDKLHEDDCPHWDVSKGDKKVKEVDKDGNQIWPSGKKNKNKKP